LRSCTSLQCIVLYLCGINDEQVSAIVEAIRGHHMLKKLYLNGNNIGNVGCGAIATLLKDAKTNIHTLNLCGNIIGSSGATAIANSLAARNTTLQKLDLSHNSINNQRTVEESFCKVLCNTSNIASTYSSNHTLKSLNVSPNRNGDQLSSLLQMNNNTKKGHVAVKKILEYHPNIDMEPMFEWDAEEGEQNLKALPYVIGWVERAQKAVEDDVGDSEKVREITFKFNPEHHRTAIRDANEAQNKLIKSKSVLENNTRRVAELLRASAGPNSVPRDYTLPRPSGKLNNDIEQRKLSAILQFAKAMPLLFGGIASINIMDGSGKSYNKRKKTNGY